MFRTLLAPINVQLELTSACNLKCSHCYNYWRNDPDGKIHLEIAPRDKLLEGAISEILSNNVFHVTLTGGEPLIALKKNAREIARLSDAGVDIHLNSNLASLDEEAVKLLKQLGVKSILTSLMAANPDTHDMLSNTPGSFFLTCAGIRLAQEFGFPVAVNMVVTKKNLPYILETGRFVKSIGGVGFCATKASRPATCPDFSEYGLDREELQRMFINLMRVHEETGLGVDSLEHYPACSFPDSETRSILGGRSCSAGKTGCTIGFDGLIRPCSHARKSYGDIFEGLRPAWVAMQEWRDGSLVPVRCKDECKEFPSRCGGGCRVESENFNGALNGHDPYCVGGSPPKKKSSGHSSTMSIQTVTPSSGIRFRHEDIGWIAYLSPKRWLHVDEILTGFLQSGSAFSVMDLASAYNVDVDQARHTLRLLVSKKLVSEGEDKR